MSTKDNEREIQSLDTEINLIQAEKFINDFDKAMNKDLKKRLKRVALVLSPVIITFIGTQVFNIPALIIMGSSISCVMAIAISVKDGIEEVQKINPPKINSNISNKQTEKSVDEILKEPKLEGKDFYSEKYKAVLKRQENSKETSAEKKYREAVEKQNEQRKNKISLVDKTPKYLDKDATMIQIVKEIDAYLVIYNSPPLEISNKEWDTFFNIAYKYFEAKGIAKDFYPILSQINRFVFSKSLINKEEKITINHFINNLSYLESDVIKKEEITELQQEILSKLKTTEIYYFSDYVQEKRRK